jgi:hypothetical protein
VIHLHINPDYKTNASDSEDSSSDSDEDDEVSDHAKRFPSRKEYVDDDEDAYYTPKQKEIVPVLTNVNDLFNAVSSSTTTTNKNVAPYLITSNDPVYEEYHNNYSETTYPSPNTST